MINFIKKEIILVLCLSLILTTDSFCMLSKSENISAPINIEDIEKENFEYDKTYDEMSCDNNSLSEIEEEIINADTKYNEKESEELEENVIENFESKNIDHENVENDKSENDEQKNYEPESNESENDKHENDEPKNNEPENNESKNEELENDKSKNVEINNDTISRNTNEYIASLSEIENDFDLHDEILQIEQETDTKFETLNISTFSETYNIDNLIASSSDTFINTQKQTLTNDADLYEQLIYYDENSVEKFNGKIKLIKDIEIYNTLYINNNCSLDLNSYHIYISTTSNAIQIKNATFSVYDDSVDIETDPKNPENKKIKISEIKEKYGSIESKISGSTLIYLDNANLNLYGGTFIGAKNTITIESKNSSILEDGALIYGGDGVDNYDGQGRNGACAISFQSKNNNDLICKNGIVKGGNGGNGKGDAIGLAGFGAKENERIIFDKDYSGPFIGKSGESGGGNGAEAIIIDNEKNLYFSNCLIYGGNGGKNIDKTTNNTNNIKLLKSDPDEDNLPSSYCSINDNLITSTKDQSASGTCWAFTTIACAETNMLKEHNDFTKSLISQQETELDLSETHLIHHYYNPIPDFLGIAPNIHTDYTLSDGNNALNIARYLSTNNGISLDRNYKNNGEIGKLLMNMAMKKL